MPANEFESVRVLLDLGESEPGLTSWDRCVCADNERQLGEGGNVVWWLNRKVDWVHVVERGPAQPFVELIKEAKEPIRWVPMQVASIQAYPCTPDYMRESCDSPMSD